MPNTTNTLTSEEIIVLAIAGSTASGKTGLCRLLAEHYGEDCVIFPADNYFKGRALMDTDNMDDPSAIDWPLYIKHLEEIKAGITVTNVPTYDMTTSSRKIETITLVPKKIVITDGLLTLHTEELRRHVDIPIFVKAPADICLGRRIIRDGQERDRTEDSVRKQWPAVVECYEKHIKPSKQYAFFQVVNSNNKPNKEFNISGIIERIEEIRELRREAIPTVIDQRHYVL